MTVARQQWATSRQADVAVVGAGIVGIAHALEAARRGLRVVVFERDERPIGASIRNFGMILSLGAAPGAMLAWALRSRQVWRRIAPEAGIWWQQSGALLLAYQEDERAVANEFAGQGMETGHRCQWLGANEVVRRCPAVTASGLLGALWFPDEMIVDPREALRKLPPYLSGRHAVCFRFGRAVMGIAMPYIQAGNETWRVDRVLVCTGAATHSLFPDMFSAGGLTRCKLQMMRTVPQPNRWRLGPMIANGLSMRHFPTFSACPSLPSLKQRIDHDHPDLERWGIHLLAAQNGLGELILGDSHEYGLEPDLFDRPEIDTLILGHVRTFLAPPTLAIAQRWHGIYAKHATRPVFLAEPEPNVYIVNGLGGMGMSASFGLAQDVFENWKQTMSAA